MSLEWLFSGTDLIQRKKIKTDLSAHVILPQDVGKPAVLQLFLQKGAGDTSGIQAIQEEAENGSVLISVKNSGQGWLRVRQEKEASGLSVDSAFIGRPITLKS